MDQEKAISVRSTHQYNATENSRFSADEAVSEAIITISSDETSKSTATSIIKEHQDHVSVKARLDEAMVKNVEEEKCSLCVIECVEYGKLGDGESQSVCRICHLSACESGKSLVDLIELGCGCKGELGFAHSYCAEAWFKLKGNRLCEICGENAKNITGVVDNKFMEEWNENISTSNGTGSSDRRRGSWHGQKLCNLLIACLVIAFVLPWFFRVNIF